MVELFIQVKRRLYDGAELAVFARSHLKQQKNTTSPAVGHGSSPSITSFNAFVCNTLCRESEYAYIVEIDALFHRMNRCL